MNTTPRKLILLSFCLSALATLRGEYVMEAGAGVSYITPMDVKEVNIANGASFPTAILKMKAGPVIFISPGFEAGKWGVAVDLNYSKSDVSSLRPLGNVLPTAGAGYLEVYTVTPSVRYTLLQGHNLRWNISAGAGASDVKSDKLGARGGSDFSTSKDAVFTFKLGSSIGYDLSSKVALSLGYAYYQSDQPRLHTNSSTRLQISEIGQTQFYLSALYKW
jgi:hypothetical protein